MGKRKIYFRADAGANIGYGHFIRTLALADMLKDDFECRFFTQSPTEYQKQELEKVCDFVALPSDESKFDLFLTYLKGDEIVVLDNYFFTTEYQREIKAKGCKLVCIDDIHDKHYVADVVINHGLADESLFSVESYTRLCLGLEWMLLRKPFWDTTPNSPNRHHPLHTVSICFGGVDCYDLTKTSIIELLKFDSISKIIPIVGDGYLHNRIDNNRVIYCSNLTADQMAETLKSSDLAILSTSTVCLEALACGVPVIAGWYVDNQKEFYNCIAGDRIIKGLGDMSNRNFQDRLKSLLLECFLNMTSTNKQSKKIVFGKSVDQKYRTLFKNLL